MTPSTRDPWTALRRHTSARIALGRSGGSLPTEALLSFRSAHAAARDAVQAPFDRIELRRILSGLSDDTFLIRTQAEDRQQYLRRPDLGRKLAQESCVKLAALREQRGASDLLIIVSDGLSSLAATRQVPVLLRHLLPALRSQGFGFCPILIAPFARVKLQDEAGALLGARMSLVLLGERPGLGSPDSLGAYFTWAPKAACTDADRNCVSNIRPGGLPPEEAAQKLARLLLASRALGYSGVRLKDSSEQRLTAA